MKHIAIIMVPHAVEFDPPKGKQNITNAALALCRNFQSVNNFESKLLAVQPKDGPKNAILVSDPPPMVA